IKLVKGDQTTMEKGPDGLMHTKSGRPAQADADVQVESGFLQASNVNAVDEMTSVLALSRQFELHIKMMKTAEQDDESMARVLQMG
ncbi:MAG: flagellar basal body rod C-terminal domain-containing protein, partial [Pseudomonas graminis]